VRDFRAISPSFHEIALPVLLLSLAGAAEGQKSSRDLTEASLEDLMNIEVTTVSKKEQRLAQAPAPGQSARGATTARPATKCW
jgi:hypothetical protein